jgi:uncharacterized small protein (DUF1192 family)
MTDEQLIEAMAEAWERARCPGREGPFGGYDYGHDASFYGPAPEAGRYVIRDFRDPASPDWGKWLHQTNDREEYEAMFDRMTKAHCATAALAALRKTHHLVPRAAGDDGELVERLRYTYEHGIFAAAEKGMLAGADEAADRITALSAEVERLKARLDPGEMTAEDYEAIYGWGGQG